MIIRLLIRKAGKITFWLLLVLASIVLLLQNSKIQNSIIDAIAGHDIDVTISNSTGFFPFSFSFDRIQIKFKSDPFNTFLDVKNVYIRLSKKLTHILDVKIEEATISSNNMKGLDFSDIQKILQIACYKIAKRVAIDKLSFNNSQIQNIYFSLDNALGLRILNFMINKKNYEAQMKIQNPTINLSLAESNLGIDIIYGLLDKRIGIHYQSKSHGKFSFDGICFGNSVTGIINLHDYNQKLSGQFSMENGKANAKIYSKNIGLAAVLNFDIANERLSIDEAFFDNGIEIKPFIMQIGKNIPNIEILLKTGVVNIEDLNLFAGTPSIGRIEIKNAQLSEILKGESLGNGLVDGIGTCSNGIMHFVMKLTDWQFGEINIPFIDITADWCKNSIKATLGYDLMKKRNVVDCNLDIENWLPSRNSRIRVKSFGNFTLPNHKSNHHSVISGQLIYNIDVSGTILKPIFTGKIEIKDLVYMNPSLNTFIKNGALLASIKNNCIALDKIYARDDSSPNGTITGGGKMTLSKDKLDTDIFLDLHDFNAIEVNEFYGKIHGKINAKGDLLKSIKISGELYSENAKLDISNLITNASRSIEILDTKKSEPKTQKSTPIIQWPIDIKFVFKNGLQIISELGINSTWNGGVSISGTASNPKYHAKITMAKGAVKVSGKKFSLKDGEIWMDSAHPDITNVRVSAVKSLDGIKVGAKFTQDLNGAKVIFFSKPYLPNVDVLSYLLFDKRSSEISTGEAFTLFSMMGKLSNSGGFDVVDKLKSVLGIDALEIKRSPDAAANEQTSVSIGKKIGSFHISIDQGTGKDTTKVMLEKKIAKRTKITADLSGKNSLGFGLAWSRRY
ncbi:MAG: translocation/assembly module TamB domain-containing protein [Holosporales bacterium]|nr:translocation/assembly module TamB domain-containing protein [Holosporales bacterium]